MGRTKGSFSLAGAIEPLISAPLDARDKVATKAELTVSGNFPYPYVGMETYVVAEDKKYRLIGDDPTDIENWKEVAEGGGGSSALSELTDVDLDNPTDGQVLKYDGEKWVNGEGGGGDASLESAVTSNLAVGAIASGTTLPKGTTFTEFAQKLLITEIAPTTTFSASGSGVKEVGTSVTPTLTLVINSKGTGTPLAIKFYDGSTLLDTQDYVDGTNTYTFVMASYYGAVATAPTDKAGIVALTKNVKNTKALTATFTLSNQRSCYCYPASFGNLSSIKDANNFEYISSYTKTTVAVDGVDYNVYTLTDAVTATGFKQVYA